jgi:hypothetical protein
MKSSPCLGYLAARRLLRNRKLEALRLPLSPNRATGISITFAVCFCSCCTFRRDQAARQLNIQRALDPPDFAALGACSKSGRRPARPGPAGPPDAVDEVLGACGRS